MDEFSKAINDLEAIDVKLTEEDKAIMLLNALSKSYDHMKDATLYGKTGTIAKGLSTKQKLNKNQKFNKRDWKEQKNNKSRIRTKC